GTPVETTERSTRRAFSPLLEERPDGSLVFENYMDAYSIKQSIEDGATVEVLYEPRLADWQIENTDLDGLFEEAFADLDEDQRDPSFARGRGRQPRDRGKPPLGHAQDHRAVQGSERPSTAAHRELHVADRV